MNAKFLHTFISLQGLGELADGSLPKKIGFLGLSSVFLNEKLTVRDPFKVLKGMIDELESKTDMVILLFNASEKDLNRLKTKNYPIDFTIRSRSNYRSFLWL